MNRKSWLCASLVAAWGWTGAAVADVLHATRVQPLYETSHNVDIQLADGVATYKVRRQFVNPGRIADEAGLAIDLPAGAAATGLRIRARSTWYDGELMEREKAAALYHELTGFGAYQPKDPALLQWQWADKLYLQVFPVLPGSVSTVEYTLTVPTRYQGGRFYVSYPRVDPGTSEGVDGEGTTLRLATPIVSVHPGWGDLTTPIFVDGRQVAADTPIVLSAPQKSEWETQVAELPGASYVASTLVVAESSHTQREFSTAKVVLDISHTYKSDLRVELLPPSGKSVILHDRSGSGDNNLKGRFEVKLPPGTKGAGTWRLVASDHAGLDTGSIDGWELVLGDTAVKATDTPVFIPDAPQNSGDAGVATIAVAAPPIQLWSGRLGRVVASDAHAFSRLELDVAPQLAKVPQHAQVVFVVDASYSAGQELLKAQLDMLRAYLSHVPDAEVEVVVYRRHASRLLGRFVSARQISDALEAARGQLALGNGSALDEAAQLAARLLSTRRGPRRLLLATDELLRSSLTSQAALAALAALPPDAIVHVVAPTVDGDDRPSIVRADQHALAPLATAHHGIFAELHGLPAKTIKDLAPAVLELVRPTRVDGFAVAGLKVDHPVLQEGDGLRIMLADKSAPTRVVLTGKLWSDPVRRELRVGAKFSQQTAAFVFGADEYHDLSTQEQLRVARMGRAVSPVTSYVAAEPGTRPSTIGLGDMIGEAYGAGGLGLSGQGHGGGGVAFHPDLRALIDVKPCVRAHRPAAPWQVTLAVETTRDEIVDVRVEQGGNQPIAACLVEAVWAVRLDGTFDRPRQRFVVQLGS